MSRGPARVRGPSPLKPVGPNDPPRSLCNDCGKKYNPYKFKKCPVCHDLYDD